MALKNDYQRVADRSLQAADSAIAANIHEKGAFLCYHSFESTGSALAEHCNLPVGPRVTHATKLNNFLQAARIHGNHRAVAAVAVAIGSLRNHFLYPIVDRNGITVSIPEHAITPADSRRLRSRVGGIVNWVRARI